VWRAAANMAISAALYLPRSKTWPSRSNLKIHVWRSVIVVVMAFLFFWGIGRVPLAQAIALTFIAPLIALLLAALVLDEHIGSRSIAGSAVAFAGVLVIVLGQARMNASPDVLLGTAALIGSALCYAVNIVLMRRQALTARPLEINFFQCVTILAIWILALPLVGVPQWPGGQWLWIAVAAGVTRIAARPYVSRVDGAVDREAARAAAAADALRPAVPGALHATGPPIDGVERQSDADVDVLVVVCTVKDVHLTVRRVRSSGGNEQAVRRLDARSGQEIAIGRGKRGACDGRRRRVCGRLGGRHRRGKQSGTEQADDGESE